MKRVRIAMLIAAAAVIGAGYYWRTSFPTLVGTETNVSAPATPRARAAGTAVVVAKAISEDFQVRLSAIGWVEPIQSVAVKSRVQSQLLEQHFESGQTVQKGDLLFVLDDRELQAQVEKDKAQLARDQALRVRTAADLARDQQLLARNAGTQQAVDQAIADDKSAAATLLADQAALDTDLLRLSYAKIYAPIGGRVGIPTITPGNLVNASDTGAGLVTITQMAPLRVSFSVPERQLPQIKAALAKSPPAEVRFKSSEASSAAASGQLSFVDSTVDIASGTVGAKAQFPNTDLALWPGLYGDVDVILETRANAVMIPTVAAQIGQRGQYVFVVKPDQTVELRDVKLGGADGDRTEVLSGVKADESVVIDGQLRLSNGARVNATEGKPPAQSAAADLTPASTSQD